MSENSNSTVDALLGMIQAQLLDVNVCLPATIVSYENGIARVSPTPKKRFADGDVLDYPTIPNVRVCWPQFAGGAAGIKGPVKPGDRCLLVFAQQAVDGSDDTRMFDLQDAYAVMCDLGNTGSSDGANNDDMTMFFGKAFIRLTDRGELKINAPGGTTLDTTTLQANATTSTVFDTPRATTTGAHTVKGAFTYQSGMTGTGATKLTGAVTQSGGAMTSNGIAVATHTHGGVSAGPSSTGLPQ